MTYFNPEIYNYDNLNDQNKKVIDIYDWALQDLENAFLNSIQNKDESSSVIEKMTAEIQEKFAEEIMNYMQSSRLEFIVSLLDNEEVKE